MPIIARNSGGKDFTPAPEGTWAGVCCDVMDQGEQENPWGSGTRHMIQIKWQLGEDAGTRDDGKPWLITKFYRLSLNEKAILRKDLEDWRGKAFSPEELDGFDVEKVIGAACLLHVMHREAESGKVYANIRSIMPLPKGMATPAIEGYIRVQDRTEEVSPVAEPTDHLFRE